MHISIFIKAIHFHVYWNYIHYFANLESPLFIFIRIRSTHYTLYDMLFVSSIKAIFIKYLALRTSGKIMLLHTKISLRRIDEKRTKPLTGNKNTYCYTIHRCTHQFHTTRQYRDSSPAKPMLTFFITSLLLDVIIIPLHLAAIFIEIHAKI